MSQIDSRVARAIVRFEASREAGTRVGGSLPPEFTVLDVTRKYGLDWGEYENGMPVAAQLIRNALNDAVTDGLLNRLDVKTEGQWALYKVKGT